MNTSTNVRLRPQSAKYTSNGKRHSTLRSAHKDDVRLACNSQTQMATNKPFHSISRITAPEIRRLLPRKTDMSPERLFEENMILKKRLNELQEELRLERAKGETATRRNAKWKKKLDVQFEKELYWGQKGEYVVMGVKNQYDKMKKLYEEKCKEIQNVRREIQYTEQEELRTELDAYREEASRLKEELDKFIEAYKIPYEVEPKDSPTTQLFISQLKDNIERCEYEISTYKTGIRNMDKLVKDRDEKIEFLQKLVVDKDNYSHQMEQSSRKLQHDNDSLRTKNKEMKEQLDEERLSLKEKISNIKESEERRFEKELSIFEAEISAKNEKVFKLEAEIGYLSTLLAQWKPSENSDSIRHSTATRMIEQKPSLHIKESNTQSLLEVQELTKSRELNELSKSLAQQNSQVLQPTPHKKPAAPTHFTLKRNKVKREEIQPICLEIKFRLLSKKVDFETAMEYIRSIEGQEISIGNLIQILNQEPFCLESLERRILVARYLVEDIDESIIYYDEERSAPEVIVRSIFDQIIPKYTIPSHSQESQIRDKVVEMLSKYSVTLTQVVSQHNKQMVLTQKKFLDILAEQELDMGAEYNDFMMAHMLKGSPDINQMSFRELLTLVPPKG